MPTFKVAEHSFRAPFCDAIQRVPKDFKNKHAVNRAIILFTGSTPALSVFFCSIIERSVFVTLVFASKDMLEKVTMQRTQQFSAFVCYRKNPVKWNVCAVAQKIETDCFCRNVCRFLISRHLAKKMFRNHVNDISREI